MALKRHVAIYKKAETVMLESPVRDSKANGAAERAVRSWVGQLRTIRHHVERRIKEKIPKDSATGRYNLQVQGSFYRQNISRVGYRPQM